MISDILYSIVAGGLGTLTALCIPLETKNYLLWRVPVTFADYMGETYGISPAVVSVLIGFLLSILAYVGFTFYRKIKNNETNY